MRKSLEELNGFKLGDRVIMNVQGYYAGALGTITHLSYHKRDREARCLIVPDESATELTRPGDGFVTILGHVEKTDIPFGGVSPISVASFGVVF